MITGDVLCTAEKAELVYFCTLQIVWKRRAEIVSMDEGRTLIIDDFYTNIELKSALLQRKAHILRLLLYTLYFCTKYLVLNEKGIKKGHRGEKLEEQPICPIYHNWSYCWMYVIHLKFILCNKYKAGIEKIGLDVILFDRKSKFQNYGMPYLLVY